MSVDYAETEAGGGLAPPIALREYGETFAPADIGWIDFEAKGPVDIKDGTYRYMREADPLILAAAIGDAPAFALPWPLSWATLPGEIRAHHERVLTGKAVWAAYHAAFDREVWNQLTDFPELEPEHIIDVMAQAMAAGLPGALDGAARFSGSGRKASEGKRLIKLFCVPAEDGTYARPEDHPADWALFLEYAANDVEVMRAVFRHTLQLPKEEWEEYWVSERINLRGIGFDPKLAEHAARIADVDKKISGGELTALTAGAVTSVTQVKRMIPWLNGVLDAPGRAIMVRQLEETDEETGEITKAEKLSLNRARIRLLVTMLQAKPNKTIAETNALRLLAIREFGGSTTPAKFGRMLDMGVDGELLGSYRFNGAPQTGRFSSTGVQIHNLMRDALANELDVIDALLDGCSHATLAALDPDTPVSRMLSMVIRPTLIPAPDNAFVWGDWSQIEARVLPWLAGPSGNARLDIFRQVDEDPSIPDLYVRSAADISGLDIAQIDKPLRQRGKVTELACGFGGGRNALQNMAANYNMHLDDADAADMVYRWRDANPWATEFWQDLWNAVLSAMEAPGHEAKVGRVKYIYLKDYLQGTLLCQLPCGRMLTYRGIKWERIDETDDDGVITESKWELTFKRAYGRIKLWPGFLAENITQATSADVLRQTLVRLYRMRSFPPVRAHTHDEVLTEVNVSRAEEIEEILIDVMEQGFDWSVGLPIKAEGTIAYSYSKCEAAWGL